MRIVEVGPRDGLQNEKTPISTELKLAFIGGLIGAGLQDIEVTSFVSPKWVPQLADASDLWKGLPQGATFSALVPNQRGLENAMAAGVQRIALFTAASDAFVQKNLSMSLADSLATFRDLVSQFRERVPGGWVRGYVSTIFECPYAGRIEPHAVIKVVRALEEIGVDEVSLGDTIGVGVPDEVDGIHTLIDDAIGQSKIAWHFHDTRGTAIANVARCLDLGYEVFDSSAGGLGGCPYAPGAGGNLATDDLTYFLERNGVNTGVNPVDLAKASLPILEALGRSPQSKAQLAVLSACT